MTKPKVLICPYCGDTQAAGDRCRVCGGLFEPLSRQATHNAMGPWFIRNESRPFQPGCSYETVIKLVERGTVNKYSIIRSPTTKQFWTVAKHVPGIAHLLGYCHNCDASVDPGDHGCHACGVPFGAYLDRNFLGLPDVRPMPWEAPAGEDDASLQPTRQAFDFRRAAEPVGISSFASDEELRAGGVEPISHYDPPGGNVPAFGGSVGQGVAAARFPTTPATMGSAIQSAPAAVMSEPASLAEKPSIQPAAGFGGSGPPSGISPSSASAAVTSPGLATVMLETSPAGIAARAMQRRLDLQRRKIRTLTFAVFALAVILVVIVAVMLATKDDSAQQEEGESQPAAKQAPPKEATPTDRSKPVAAPPVPASAPAADAAPAATAAAEQAVPKPDAAAERKVQLEEAQNLLTEARKNERPAADRIHDYEAALKILKAIAQKLPAEERPVDLDPTIRQAEQEMERLKLKEFFP